MSALSNIPWDLVAEGVAATVQAIRRARDVRQARDIVAAIKMIGRVATVDVDKIVDRVLNMEPIDGGGPLDEGD